MTSRATSKKEVREQSVSVKELYQFRYRHIL